MKMINIVDSGTTNNFGDLERHFELFDCESKKVVLSQRYLHHEGSHTSFMDDLKDFKKLIKGY